MPDLIVAALLTLTLIGTLTTFTIRTGRLMVDTRKHQVAIDELSNQLESLLVLDEESLVSAIRDLKPSDEAVIALPEAVLSAERSDDSHGKRIALHLNWNRGTYATPLRLVGWINPRSDEALP